jgi:hypothetical protein
VGFSFDVPLLLSIEAKSLMLTGPGIRAATEAVAVSTEALTHDRRGPAAHTWEVPRQVPLILV